jgi:hypothetical protein
MAGVLLMGCIGRWRGGREEYFGLRLADISRHAFKPRQPHTKQQEHCMEIVDQALEMRRLKYMYHVTRRRS